LNYTRVLQASFRNLAYLAAVVQHLMQIGCKSEQICATEIHI